MLVEEATSESRDCKRMMIKSDFFVAIVEFLFEIECERQGGAVEKKRAFGVA